MTTLRELSAAAVGHLVAIRDMMAADAAALIQHVEAIDPDHKYRPMADDFALVSKAWFARICDAINDLDPNAPPASLEPPPAPNYGGMILTQNELEALRSQRIGQVVQQARALAEARFTAGEAQRLQQLQSQAQAAQADAAPMLTDAEMDELAALDSDRLWAVSVQDEANTRVTALLAADQSTLAAYDPTEGWPT
ncbi:MAG: hypothetical protein EBR82_58790 [Caulobacteraceae bacterium]|nr:hypothetical protein [Caulobacteraceae bacterium]